MADLDTDSPWGVPSTVAPSYPDAGGDIGAPPQAEDDVEIDAGEVLRKEELVKSASRVNQCGAGRCRG